MVTLKFYDKFGNKVFEADNFSYSRESEETELARIIKRYDPFQKDQSHLALSHEDRIMRIVSLANPEFQAALTAMVRDCKASRST